MHNLDHYKLALDITPMPTVLVSKSGVIVLSNPLFDALFEYEPNQLTGRNVDILVPETSRNSHSTLRNSYFTQPTKRNMGHGRDLNGVTSSGRIFALELGLDAVLIDQTEYALVVAVDIEPRKQYEQHMNTAMDAAASAMIMVNIEGIIVFVNKAAATLFGYEEHALIGLSVDKLVPPEKQTAHRGYTKSFMQASTSRSMGIGLDLYALHKSGRKIPVEIALTPVDMTSGKMVVSTIIDLSERVSAQRAMAKKNEELASVNTELQRFAYSASHDLKGPISTMVGLLNLCTEDLNSGDLDELRKNIDHVRQIGQRSVRKVEGVLEIARVGWSVLEPEPIDLKSVINDIWLDLMGANPNAIQLRLDLQHTNPIVQELDALKLILENLLSNAIRYSDERKSEQFIHIKSRCYARHLEVKITDNGIGIRDESKNQVFDMFKLIDDRSHSGLGLNLVRKQIDRLGGNLEFDSSFGEGTEFRFTLPMLDQE